MLTAASLSLFALLMQGPAAPAAQPRDPPIRTPAGTCSLSGRITDAETGVPLRRAIVNLIGNARRTTLTDIEGRYHFTNLPTGGYQVLAGPGPHRAGYKSLMYGGVPVAAGAAIIPKQIVLDEDGRSRHDVDIALPRTGVISGRVTDSYGEPVFRMQVSAYRVLPGGDVRPAGDASTDDLGQFRLPGLDRGEYIVMATASSGDLQTPLEGQPTGFAPTYAPGTPIRSDAMRIRVSGGMEAGADIRLTETRVYSIRGTAMNSTETLGRGISVMLFPPEGAGVPMVSTSPSSSGAFSIRNVPPGRYELAARWAPADVPVFDRRVPRPPDPNQEYVSMPLDVRDGDVDGVILVTEPAPVVTGEIVFDEKPPQFHQAIISAQASGGAPVVGPPRVEVKNRQFTIRNVFTPITLRASFPGGPTWGLSAILLRGEDITDVPTAFTTKDSGYLQVVFTAHAAALEGIVAGDDGKLTELAGVVVFGQDPTTWTGGSSYYRHVRGVNDGKFTIAGLRPGSYFVAAVPLDLSVSLLSQPTAEILASLSQAATPITLTAGETHRVELVVVRVQH